jgi:hypothetical protein
VNDEADKKPRPRSPEFPFVPLNEAIPKVQQLINANQRHAARIKTLAPLWGYSPASSSFLRIVAALRSFGLVEESGSGDDRKIAVSDLGMKIVSDTRPGARAAAIQKAFESCTTLNEYHQKWGNQRPSDSACISELTLDNGFTPTAARKFISVYDDSVTFAEANGNDGGQPPAGTPPDEESSLDVGMFVQWEQKGVLQLPQAAKLIGFSGDGDYAFVEGHETGIPRIELIKAEAPSSDIRQKPPAPKAASGGINMSEATYPITEGMCTLIYPKGISPKSAQRLKRWLDLMLEDVKELAEAQPQHDDQKQVEEKRP